MTIKCPASLDFGAVFTNPTEMSVYLTNTGTYPVEILDLQCFAYGPAQQDVFTAVYDYSIISPGQTVPIFVTFAPNAPGSYTGELDIGTNDPADSAVSILLSGSYPDVSWTPASLDFGTVPSGTTATQDLVITNAGSEDRLITDAEISGDNGFTVAPSGLGELPIPAGQTGTVTVTFSANFPWPWGFTSNATLTFQTNSPAVPSGTVPLSGSQQPMGCVTAPAALALRALRGVRRRRDDGT